MIVPKNIGECQFSSFCIRDKRPARNRTERNATRLEERTPFPYNAYTQIEKVLLSVLHAALWKDNYRSGFYMIDVRYDHPEIFHMPAALKSAVVWRLFKPLIAAWTTLQIVLKTREVRKNATIIPYVCRLKAAWCEGAVDRLEGKPNDI